MKVIPTNVLHLMSICKTNHQNRILIDQFRLGLSFRFLVIFIHGLIDDVMSMIHTYCIHKSSLQGGILQSHSKK